MQIKLYPFDECEVPETMVLKDFKEVTNEYDEQTWEIASFRGSWITVTFTNDWKSDNDEFKCNVKILKNPTTEQDFDEFTDETFFVEDVMMFSSLY